MKIKLSSIKSIRSKNKDKTIGLCHGVFDILHSGHIDHFNEAKKLVDILVVSITVDKHVNKGPRQPLNDHHNRALILNSLKMIDYVILSNKPSSIEIITKLKPNIYFKGKDYLTQDKLNNLQKEKNILKKNGGIFKLTKTKLQSSTKKFNKIYNWSSNQREIIEKVSKLSSKKNIDQTFKAISALEINIVGETIIDSYQNCEILGVTTKEPTISALKNKKIDVGGGAIAAALIASEFVKKVNLFTYGSNIKLKKHLKNIKNINLINLNQNKPIQEKMRYLSQTRGEKLIQMTNFKKNSFNKLDYKQMCKKFMKFKKNNTIIFDYGLGLFEENFLKLFNKISNKTFVNVQSNSVNLGFNLFNKFSSFKYISLDKREWLLGIQSKNIDIKKIRKVIRKNCFASITLGDMGAKIVDKKNIYYCPTLVKSVKDTTGSGDSYHIITSLMNMTKILNPLAVVFLGNLYAGMHGQNLGNTNIVTKDKFVENLLSILNI